MPWIQKCVKTSIGCLAAVLFLLWVANCSAPVDSQCSQICRRYGQCAKKIQTKSAIPSQKECIAACVALSKQPNSRTLVDKQLVCTSAGNTCQQVVKCLDPSNSNGGQDPGL